MSELSYLRDLRFIIEKSLQNANENVERILNIIDGFGESPMFDKERLKVQTLELQGLTIEALDGMKPDYNDVDTLKVGIRKCFTVAGYWNTHLCRLKSDLLHSQYVEISTAKSFFDELGGHIVSSILEINDCDFIDPRERFPVLPFLLLKTPEDPRSSDQSPPKSANRRASLASSRLASSYSERLRQRYSSRDSESSRKEASESK